jgi:tetratricopeptide (TPR) repeat protein
MSALVVAVGLFLAADPPEARDRAREAFAQGQALYLAGDFAGALAAFQAAESASPTPAAVYNIARCRERLGEIAQAVTAYESYLAQAPDAPDHDAVAGHVAELRRQLPAEGRLRVSVEPPGATVRVDLEAPEPAPLDRLLPAGHHAVRAELSGHTAADRDVELVAGGLVQLELTLRPIEPPGETTRAPDAAVREEVPPPAPRSGSGERRWTYVALTVAALCVGTALAFGVSAQNAQDQLHARVHTQTDVQQLYDTANARATAANSFYVGAAVAGATAITLFFLEPSLRSSP